MNISTIPTGFYQENCYIVWGPQNKAIIFDPGDDADMILKQIKEQNLTLAAYVCTHAHYDHINALADLHAKAPAPICIHSKDLEWAFEPYNAMAPYYSVPKKPEIDEYQFLDTKKDWMFADLHFQVIETPGHSPGGCCLLFPDSKMLITGDTLFRGSCGRSDLPGGHARQLKDSLNKLKQLPDEVQFFPGHGQSSTIGTERSTNIYMQSR